MARHMLDSFAPSSWPTVGMAAGLDAVVMAASGPHAVEHSHPNQVRVCGDLRLDVSSTERVLGVEPGTRSPSWLVTEAYERWGLEFAARLYGDFGFALWDQERRRLVLVRDPGGARPMFYASHGAIRLAYSSHPRGLLSLAEIPRDLDQRAVIDYLGELPQEESHTFFAAVKRVPPGCLLVADDRGVRITPYLDVRQVAELRLGSDEEYALALREELSRAVAARARGGCAVMLSGGLDSSAVTALARRAAPPEQILTTISAVFPEFSECDERSYQAAMVSAVGSNHHEVRPSPASEAGNFLRLSQVFSEPSFIGPHWIAWAAAEVAKREGATTMLTGIDGDRVISHGSGRFADLANARDWQGLARELAAVDDFGWLRRARVFGVHAAFAMLPGAFAKKLDEWDPRRVRRFDGALSLLLPRQLERHGVLARLRALPQRPTSSREQHARSLQVPDRNWDVELLDQLGTAFDITFAQPFFDRRVMELCYSFPGSQKRQAGWSRYVLRNAMRGLVPNSILARRRDATFDRPYWAWAKEWRALQPLPSGYLERLADYVNVPKVKRLLNGIPSHSAGGPVDFVERCVILTRWLHEPGLPMAESLQPAVQRT